MIMNITKDTLITFSNTLQESFFFFFLRL